MTQTRFLKSKRPASESSGQADLLRTYLQKNALPEGTSANLAAMSLNSRYKNL